MEIHRIPVISIAHLAPEDAAAINACEQKWVPSAPYEYGAFLYLDVTSDDSPTWPQCLQDIGEWLLGLQTLGQVDPNCWVRLDCDADTVPDLPTYEW